MTRAPFSDEGTECAEHPGRRATGRCSVCGKPICGQCTVQSGVDPVCTSTDHLAVARSWIVIRRTPSEFEADMISRTLDFHGVETKVFSTRAFKFTLGEDPEDGVNVFVRKEDLGRATEVLQSLDSGNGVDPEQPG